MTAAGIADRIPRRERPGWAARYIGLPYARYGRTRDGLNCWGLVAMVLREVFEAPVPAYEGYGIVDLRADGATLADFISGERDQHWREVARPDAATAELAWRLPERLGDLVLTRYGRHPVHIGIVIARGEMLTVEAGTETHVADYRVDPVRRRVVGVYRHGMLP